MRQIALCYCSKFQKNLTAFAVVMAITPPRSSLKSNFLLLRNYLKVYNLATTNAILMKLTTIMYLHDTFHLGLGLQDYIKTCNTCDALYWNIGLHCCFKFQKNLTAFGGVKIRKPPRSSLQWQFLLVGKHLKIHNLATTNAKLMKLTTIMYLHGTFYLAKDWGVTHRA